MKTKIEELQQAIDELRQQIPKLRQGAHDVAAESRNHPVITTLTGLGLTCALGQALKSALNKPQPSTFKDRVGSVADSARDSVAHFVDGAKESLHDATGAVTAGAHGIRDQFSHAHRKPQASGVREFVRENPVICGAGVLATGLLAGFLISRSRSEQHPFGDHFGERSRQLFDDAKAAGAGVVEETKSVVKEKVANADAAVREAAKAASAAVHDTGEAIREKMAGK